MGGEELGGEGKLGVDKSFCVQVVSGTRGGEALVRVAGCRQSVLLVQLQETVERTVEEKQRLASSSGLEN